MWNLFTKQMKKRIGLLVFAVFMAVIMQFNHLSVKAEPVKNTKEIVKQITSVDSNDEITVVNTYDENFNIISRREIRNESSKEKVAEEKYNETGTADNQITLKLDNYYDEDPSIRNIYFQNQIGTWKFDYRERMSIETIKHESGYLITLGGFDWNLSDNYYIWIKNGEYLLKSVVNSSDVGKTIEVNANDTFTKVQVSVPHKGENFSVEGIALHQKWDNGKTILIDYIHDVYIPSDEYSIQVLAHDDKFGYSLMKEDYKIENNNIITFEEDELAKVVGDMKNDVNVNFTRRSICPSYFISTYNVTYPTSAEGVYLSKAQYRNLWFHYETENRWLYEYAVEDSKIDGDRIINFDTNLAAKIKIDHSNFNSGDMLSIGEQLKICDGIGNQITWILNGNEDKSVGGIVELKNGEESYSFQYHKLNHEEITLPDTTGTFDMTYKVEEGPLTVTPASTQITINGDNGDQEFQSEITLALEDYGDDPEIAGVYFEGQEGRWKFNVKNNMNTKISKVENGYLVDLEGFDWNLSDKYYIWIRNGEYLLKAEVSSVDIDKTIDLKPDDTYTKLQVSVPNKSENFRVQGIVLHHQWNGGREILIYDIDRFNDNLYVPSGEYAIQLTGYDDKFGYSLIKENYKLSNNNVITFDENEMAKIVVEMNNDTEVNFKNTSICPNYFITTSNVNYFPNAEGIYLSKIQYRDIWLWAETEEGWGYEYSAKNPEIHDGRTFYFDTNLEAKLNLDRTTFNAGEFFRIDNQLKICDSLGNELSWIQDPNADRIGAALVLKNDKDSYSFYGEGLDFPEIKLPETSGTFELTYTLNQNPLGIAPATAEITIGSDNEDIPVTGISIDKTETVMTEGETLQLHAAVLPENASNKNITWHSDKEAVVTVDSNGLLTALSEGNAVITVTTVDGNYTAECKVTVEPKELSGKIEIEMISPAEGFEGFKVGGDAKVTVRAINNSNEDKTVTLIVGLYDERNRFINYAAVEKILKSEETVDLTGAFRILSEGHIVKCMVWDTLENMMPLTDVIEIPVIK